MGNTFARLRATNQLIEWPVQVHVAHPLWTAAQLTNRCGTSGAGHFSVNEAAGIEYAAGVCESSFMAIDLCRAAILSLARSEVRLIMRLPSS